MKKTFIVRTEAEVTEEDIARLLHPVMSDAEVRLEAVETDSEETEQEQQARIQKRLAALNELCGLWADEPEVSLEEMRKKMWSRGARTWASGSAGKSDVKPTRIARGPFEGPFFKGTVKKSSQVLKQQDFRKALSSKIRSSKLKGKPLPDSTESAKYEERTRK